MRNPPMIETDNLTYAYPPPEGEEDAGEGVTAVDGVSLTVRQGEFIALLGHNGSGKSTFARLLNALLLPKSGTVIVDGIDTANEELVFEIRSRVGMVFQNPDNQIISAVVEEDVAFGPENLGVPEKELRTRVDESLKAVGMYEERESSPNRLSGGQKQRISIAGVLAMRPKCIVLDEATAMLDPGGRSEVIDAVRTLNKREGITVVLITHHMDEAVHADHVYCMENGRIAFHGTPREVFSQAERLTELGLSVPQVTALGLVLRQRGLPLPDGILTAEELVDELFRIRERRRG